MESAIAVQLLEIVSPLIWLVTRLLMAETELKKVLRLPVKELMLELYLLLTVSRALSWSYKLW